MRQNATPTLVTLRAKLRKHIKNSKAHSRKLRRRSLKVTTPEKINYLESALLRAFLPKFKDLSRKFEKNSKVTTPKNFSIFENYEGSLAFIKTFLKTTIANPRLISIDHRNTKKWSLGSESLLGVLTKEIYRLCSKQNFPCDITGKTSRDEDYQDVINAVGVVSELPDHEFEEPTTSDVNLIHTFKQDCTLSESSSISAKDLNNKTALGFVEHLTNCLKDHKLKLNKRASDGLEACMGELLDNVHEHCGLSTPKWYVRAYINNSSSNRILEISVFNVGATFAETFDKLQSTNFSKRIADKYVQKHLSKHLSKDALLTIAALQGNVSSKNEGSEDTRGHGTITIIETFENLYKNYSKLRIKGNTDKQAVPVMNLISGSVMIKFNDKYSSFKVRDSGGGERVLISFNDESDLAFAPDSTYITTMKRGYFPGTMINIQVPLNGSLHPIKEK
jgi:hypothetical protein